MSGTLSTATRAAASSSASGSPSSCQHTCTTAERFCAVSSNDGDAARARSTKSWTAGASSVLAAGSAP